MFAAHGVMHSRMPKDLRHWLATQSRKQLDFSATAREPFRDLRKEAFAVGSFAVMVYFGACRKDTFVVVHFPGGLSN